MRVFSTGIPLSQRPNTTPDEEFDEEHELALIELQQGRLLDKYGNEHSEAVFKNWTPQAIRALGVRRVKDDGGENA